MPFGYGTLMRKIARILAFYIFDVLKLYIMIKNVIPERKNYTLSSLILERKHWKKYNQTNIKPDSYNTEKFHAKFLPTLKTADIGCTRKSKQIKYSTPTCCIKQWNLWKHPWSKCWMDAENFTNVNYCSNIKLRKLSNLTPEFVTKILSNTQPTCWLSVFYKIDTKTIANLDIDILAPF